MTRLFILVTLLMLSSEPAYADWVWASSNDQVGLTIFIDPDTIRRNGDLVKLWQLYDYKTIQTVGGRLVFVQQGAKAIRLCKTAHEASCVHELHGQHGKRS